MAAPCPPPVAAARPSGASISLNPPSPPAASQSARDKASKQFREARSAILFSSDVSARGVDYPDVTLVLQAGVAAGRSRGRRRWRPRACGGALQHCRGRGAGQPALPAADSQPASMRTPATPPIPTAPPPPSPLPRWACPPAASSTSTGWGAPRARGAPAAACCCSCPRSSTSCASSRVRGRVSGHACGAPAAGLGPCDAQTADGCLRAAYSTLSALGAADLLQLPAPAAPADLPLSAEQGALATPQDEAAVRAALPRVGDRLPDMVSLAGARGSWVPSLGTRERQLPWAPPWLASRLDPCISSRVRLPLPRGCPHRLPPSPGARPTPPGWASTTAPRAWAGPSRSWCSRPTASRVSSGALCGGAQCSIALHALQATGPACWFSWAASRRAQQARRPRASSCAGVALWRCVSAPLLRPAPPNLQP